ncbi:MAG TPA: RNA ligase family protein [Rhodothermales bacterium]|nr:RNA ligase family protein [Rhodothermales bacterium]
MNSTHRVEVVPVELMPHPNADSLSVVKVFDGYTVCVRTADWQGRDRGAYVPPDSVVPGGGPFAFLGDSPQRIRVKRLRGVVSMGLLVPAPEGAQVGDDVAAALGVTHYDPPQPLSTGGEAAPAPRVYAPCYDVESLRRYASAFVPGEPVFATEKIHGANGRFLYTEDGGFHCGSRTEWKRESAENVWWRALHGTPGLGVFLSRNPGVVVYGEVYGQVQDLKYGTAKGEVRFAAFDLLVGGEWVAPIRAREWSGPFGLPWVPTIASGEPFDLATALKWAEGPSLVPGADHVREGCVVKPMNERCDLAVGRVCLKVVGNGYMERA